LNVSKWSNFYFKSAFEIQKQTKYYETQLQKHIKTASQFFSGLHNKKYNLECYQIFYCVFYIANTKTTNKQTQPKYHPSIQPSWRQPHFFWYLALKRTLLWIREGADRPDKALSINPLLLLPPWSTAFIDENATTLQLGQEA
jgi:hypothetical protein